MYISINVKKLLIGLALILAAIILLGLSTDGATDIAPTVTYEAL